jgi:hypothetical protein
MQLDTAPRERAPNPARDRGLRRAARTRAPCEPAAWTPLPAPVDALVVLALLTRVRAARVAGGEISPERLYDVRAFKCVVAELGYLRTLTRRATGGTIVTSMPQLVKGLARLHPAWRMTGDKFADRDRHQQAVRRRLRDLDAMGLLRWRIGVDVDGEDARTELELRPAPDITDDERVAAAAALERWQARYGAALNTGSATGVRNAAGHARPLSAGERQRRGVARSRERAVAVRVRSNTNSAPRFATPTSSENSVVVSTSLVDLHDACRVRTRARTRQDEASDSWVTRHPPPDRASASAAVNVVAQTASLTMGGPVCPVGSETSRRWDESALVGRVAARLAARQPVWDMIAAQASGRATDVASWTLARSWPAGRLREAWVVWRYGSMCAGELGAAPAGRLEADDLQRLRRALTRYEHHAAARPGGFPAGGLAVLAAIAAIAAQRDARPQTLHFAIRLLDQLSRRMRAVATADAEQRRNSATARAQRRRGERRDGGSLFAFRISPWPPWVALDDSGDPLLAGDELALVVQPGLAAPDRTDPLYLATLRDAQLLAGLWPRACTDGRTAMAENSRDHHLDDAHRRARPGPYPAPTNRREHSQAAADLRLACLAAMPLRSVQRLSPQLRDELLEHHAGEQAARRSAERQTLADDLADLNVDATCDEHRHG